MHDGYTKKAVIEGKKQNSAISSLPLSCGGCGVTHIITEAEELQTRSGYSVGCTLYGVGGAVCVCGGVALEGLSRHPFLPPYPLHSAMGSLIPCVRPLPTNYLATLPFSPTAVA